MIPLTADQERELRLYADGDPLAGVRPNTNLIRRNLLMLVPPHGASAYVITEVGRAALAERQPPPGTFPPQCRTLAPGPRIRMPDIEDPERHR